MLDQKALTSAVNLLDSSVLAGKTIEALAETPLGNLVRETPPPAVPAESLDLAAAIEHLVDVSRGEEHAEILAEIVKNGTESIRRVLDITRNVVMPHITRVYNNYSARMAELGEAKMAFDIKQIHTPGIYKTSIASEMVSRWESVARVASQPEAKLAKLSAEDVMTLSRVTDAEDYNRLNEELLRADNGAAIDQITAIIGGELAIKHLNPLFSLPLMVVLENLAEPREGVAMTLSAYNLARAQMINIAAKEAFNVIARLNMRQRDNDLYYGLVQDQADVIKVTGEVYRDMTKKGLTVEMVIGNELSGRKYRGVQLLDPAVQKELQKVYEDDRAVRKNAHQTNLTTISRRTVQDVLREDQRAIAAENKFVIEGDTAEKSWMRLRDIADKVYANNISPEPSLVISAIICAVWYGHTDAPRLIDNMFTVELGDPTLNKEQIAFVGTLKYIIQWVLSQTVISVPSKETI